LKYMQDSLEAVRGSTAQVPWAEVDARQKKAISRINSLAGSPQRYRYLFSMIALPNFIRALQTTARNETQKQMTVAAIALKRFQIKYGKPAPSLEALKPEFLSAVPQDYLSGA